MAASVLIVLILLAFGAYFVGGLRAVAIVAIAAAVVYVLTGQVAIR